MRYRKKAVECELIRFDGTVPEGVSEVRLLENGGACVWNELHGSAINIEVGDFINVSTPGDIYPIKAAVVAETYEPVE